MENLVQFSAELLPVFLFSIAMAFLIELGIAIIEYFKKK